MVFIKYILSTIYLRIYKRMLKRTDEPDERIPLKFGYQLCLWIYIALFVIYRLLTKIYPFYLDLNPNISFLIGLALYLILGATFATVLNFEWIKTIELNTKQKNKCRLILFSIIILVIILFKL